MKRDFDDSPARDARDAGQGDISQLMERGPQSVVAAEVAKKGKDKPEKVPPLSQTERANLRSEIAGNSRVPVSPWRSLTGS